MAERTAPLYVQSDVTKWSPGATVPVCWITSGFEQEKAIITQALHDTWESYGNIHFVGFNLCPTTGTDLFVRVMVELGTDAGGGGSSQQGIVALHPPTADVNDRSTHIALPQSGSIGRIQYLAVHEFGHVLGFGHEQDRPDNWSAPDATCNPAGSIPGSYFTYYDPNSVMHYCNRYGNNSGWLSDGDKSGVIAAYGKRPSAQPPTQYLAVDITADENADLVYLWGGGINTFLGTGYNGPGSIGYYFIEQEGWKPRANYNMNVFSDQWVGGDADGDGRADLLHLWSGGIDTLLADGNYAYSLVGEGWKPRANYSMDVSGSRWLAGDVSGDGVADLIHLWSGGIDTLFSNGDGTYELGAEAWKPRADYNINTSTTRWLTADVNADGKADLIHLWSGGINTLLSNGNGTYSLVVEAWKPRADYSINVTTTLWLAGDVNNDAKADLIHLWDGGINTLLSNGNGTYSLVAEGWLPQYEDPVAPYVMGISDTQWLAADVNADYSVDLIHVENGMMTTFTSNGDGTYTKMKEYWDPQPWYDMD